MVVSKSIWASPVWTEPRRPVPMAPWRCSPPGIVGPVRLLGRAPACEKLLRRRANEANMYLRFAKEEAHVRQGQAFA